MRQKASASGKVLSYNVFNLFNNYTFIIEIFHNSAKTFSKSYAVNKITHHTRSLTQFPKLRSDEWTEIKKIIYISQSLNPFPLVDAF